MGNPGMGGGMGGPNMGPQNMGPMPMGGGQAPSINMLSRGLNANSVRGKLDDFTNTIEELESDTFSQTASEWIDRVESAEESMQSFDEELQQVFEQMKELEEDSYVNEEPIDSKAMSALKSQQKDIKKRRGAAVKAVNGVKKQAVAWLKTAIKEANKALKAEYKRQRDEEKAEMKAQEEERRQEEKERQQEQHQQWNQPQPEPMPYVDPAYGTQPAAPQYVDPSASVNQIY
jgi:hypothetical protein